MNIAVIIDDNILEGGAFQYSLSRALFLEKNKCGQYNFIYFTTVRQNLKFFEKSGIKANFLNWTNLDEFLSHIRRNETVNGVFRKLRFNFCNKFDRILRKNRIDLVYFTSPSPLSLATEEFNYVFTVWDLCFLDSMELPEVYAKREFERRDNLYRTAISKALRIITDSAVTKKRITDFYKVDPARIMLSSFRPSVSAEISPEKYLSGFIDIKKKYSIPGDYIYYPAQFWPHKNHAYILEGLKVLKEKYKVKISAVFSGSDKGNLKFILKKAKEMNLSGQIFYLGFVDSAEIPYLYKQSLALVMPTLLGPTNIPPLEAFKLGCPVLYSNLPVLKEQVGDAAILMDLKDPESMAKGLLRVINSGDEIKTMINKGKNKMLEIEKENFWPELKEFLDDYSLKLKTWKY